MTVQKKEICCSVAFLPSPRTVLHGGARGGQGPCRRAREAGNPHALQMRYVLPLLHFSIPFAQSRNCPQICLSCASCLKNVTVFLSPGTQQIGKYDNSHSQFEKFTGYGEKSEPFGCHSALCKPEWSIILKGEQESSRLSIQICRHWEAPH